MNETIRTINHRRSTRSFSDQPISQEMKDLIFQAAFRAPTAGNMMLYSIIEVEEQEIKNRLVETCDSQPFIAKSPLVLVFLADYQRWWDYYRVCHAPDRARELGRAGRSPQVGDFLLACCDALIAAQNAAIAAESLGIQSCYIGDIIEHYEEHRDIFNLPQYVFPIAMLCMGYPKRDYNTYPLSPRFAPQYIAFKNQYQHLRDDQLAEMFAPYEEMLKSRGQPFPGALNFGQHNYLRKFISDFSVEMSRSITEMLKNWQYEE